MVKYELIPEQLLRKNICSENSFFAPSEISKENDVDFAKRISKEIGVATIPTSVFYQNLTDHKVVRICFAKKDETLIEAAKLLSNI